MVRSTIAMVLAVAASAAPPGASVRKKVTVPAALRSAPFDADRFLTVPPGFNVSVVSRLAGVRFMAIAPGGEIIVSRPDYGTVSVIGTDGGLTTWASGLRAPHGVALDAADDKTWLYIAEEHRVVRYLWSGNEKKASAGETIVDNLPNGGHNLKNIAIGRDHSLYVSIGSSCNVCTDDGRAAIYRYAPGAGGGELFAQGLRNAEGVAFVPGTDSLWAVVNNRDEILQPGPENAGQLVRGYVDNHPPDLFTSVREGGNYGWPYCNANPDTPAGADFAPFDIDYEMNPAGKVDCGTMDRVTKGIQAHSAPLGLAFTDTTRFALPWQPGSIVALHGSWDRTEPTGYKVVYFPFTQGGPGKQEDLVVGFSDWGGRPVGVTAASDGALLISDDGTGSIYRLSYEPSAISAASGYPVIAPASYASVYAAFGPGSLLLTLTDSTGTSFEITPAWFSETQANFVVPARAAVGSARLTAQAGTRTLDLGQPEIRAVAPAIFGAFVEGSELRIVATGIRGAAQLRVIVNGRATPVLSVDSATPGVDIIRADATEGTVEIAVGEEISNSMVIIRRQP